MSESESFIEEVSEEVRRDRLFGLMRRYGWIAIAAVLLLVGGAAFNEYSKAQDRSAAQALGDATLGALELDAPGERAAALAAIDLPQGDAAVVIGMLRAAEEAGAEDTAAAVDALNSIASNGDLPEIYRQLAAFKALMLQSGTLDADARRLGFEALSFAGNPFRVMAQEQLALIDIETGQTGAALDKLRALIEDAETTSSLRNRASQLIVSLGGTIEAASQDAAAGE